ncbi:MAG: hypothetical protein GC146_09385 [Limimaricola sp.]|uniref:hypothetical protein n=1 Tax=Limimaricola sp. TaxID=2211665 RepID=UPI001DA5244D|nr:hypothetical protein [Limimaricola sp.]MBI1417422.1 hypothetical protein [Limimaricola sp.]
MIRAAAALAIALAAGPAAADGLMGRAVTFGAMVWQDRAAPLFSGERHPATVGPGVEYGLGPEGVQNGWDLVPSVVDISENRIAITYPDGEPGHFPEATFNGYILDFLVDCVLFTGAAPNPTLSTVALKPDDVFTEGSKLFINVGGQDYGPGTYIVVDVKVSDCLMG